jgi:hypothetical protein
MRALPLGLSVLLALVWSAPAAAQPLSQVLPDFIVAGRPQSPHPGHFTASPSGAATPADFAAAIGVRLVTFPVVPAWGVPADPGGASGDGLRLTGAAFGELAATGGAQRFRFALAHQGIEYGSIDGVNLRGTGLQLLAGHAPGAAHGDASDGDVVEQVVSMDLDRRVTTFSAAYGLTDRLDVGVIVPFVQVNVQARMTTFLRRAPGSPDSGHGFDALDLANRTIYGDWTRNGIGDLEARAKLRFGGGPRGLAATGGVRLPTGDEANWHGIGAWQASAGLVWSGPLTDRYGPRFHGGYTFSGTRDDGVAVPDEIHYGAGLDAAVAPRVTLSVDAIGRSLRDVALVRRGVLTTTPVGGGPGYEASDILLAPAGTGTVHGVFGSAGGRVLLTDGLLLNADVVFPLFGDGLRPKMGIVVGMNFLF